MSDTKQKARPHYQGPPELLRWGQMNMPNVPWPQPMSPVQQGTASAKAVTAAPQPPAAMQVPPPPPPPNRAALNARLAGLFARIPRAAGGSREKRQQLMAAAIEAGKLVNRADAFVAMDSIDDLDGTIADAERAIAEAELDVAPPPPPPIQAAPMPSQAVANAPASPAPEASQAAAPRAASALRPIVAPTPVFPGRTAKQANPAVSPTSAPVPQSQPLQSPQSPPIPPPAPQSQPTQSAATKGLGQVFQAGLSQRDEVDPQVRFEALERHKNEICSNGPLGPEILKSLNAQSQKTRQMVYAAGPDAAHSKDCEWELREFEKLLVALSDPKNGAPVASAQPQVSNLVPDILPDEPDKADAAVVLQARQAAFDAIAALRKISTDANSLGNLVKSDSLTPKIGSLTSKIDVAVSDLDGRVDQLNKSKLPAAKLVEGYQAVAGDARTAAALGKEIEDGWRELDKMVAWS